MSGNTSPGGFSEAGRTTLARVLDEIIPARTDGRLPGAGELGLAGYIESTLQNLPDQQAMVAEGLSDVEAVARKRHGSDFAALSPADKRALLEEQIFVSLVMFHAYVGYYQDPRVSEVLGLEPRPPHPKGYEIAPNDLTLLDAVRGRPKMYRRC